jgi:hypothetical protein
VNLDRFPSADVNAAPELSPAEDRAAAAEQFEFNSAVECAESLIDTLVADLRLQAKGHSGDWSEVFSALDYARSMLPERV